MTGIIKTDQLQGAQSSTITVPSGNNLTIGGTLGVTGIATFTDDIIIGDGKTIGSASDVDAMTIASNGQVTFSQTLIGTNLDISGNVDIDGTTNLDEVDIDGNVDIQAAIQMGASNNDVRMTVQGNNQYRLALKNGSNNHVFIGSGGADNFRVSNSSGSTLFELNSSGNIVLPSSNAGIYLGVTSATASNLLDDYEEGTFTPTLVSTGSTFAYSVRQGIYTKVGDLVTFNIVIQLDGGGNSFSSNSVALNGWPFTSRNSQGAAARFFIHGRYLDVDGNGNYNYAFAQLDGNSGSAPLKEGGDNVPIASLGANRLSSSSGQLYLHGHYYTDA